MIDYSQYGEQAHILEKLGDLKAGRLLDIGAWHATTFSNTRALIELGWSAVLVEPSPGPMRDLLKEYGKNPNITLVQALAGADQSRGLDELWVTDDALSTPDGEKRAAWEAHGYPFMGTIWVPLLLVTDLLKFGPFQFINIDTEGSSGALLEAILRTQFDKPRCICVEHDGHAEVLADVGAQCGYQAQNLGINLLLWR